VTSATCAAHVPLHAVPDRVAIIRHGRDLNAPGNRGTAGKPFLQAGDRIDVPGAGGSAFMFSFDGNRFQVPHGRLRVQCRRLLLDSGASPPRQTVLALRLRSGRVSVAAGGLARRAVVLSREMLALATFPGSHFTVDRNPQAARTRAWTRDQPIVAARASDPKLRIDTRVTYTAISDAKGLRLDIWPFSISRLQRAVTAADRLVPFWADGKPCSVGCTAPGAIPGWPVKPFHQQHAIRAGINELRPANFHVAVDIEANNFQPVYALQSGIAHIRYPGTGDVNVDVGRFYYWHVDPTVRDGQYVVAYKTELGAVLHGFGHVALSEGNTSDYLNPLRPGGSLRPYRDSEPPIIGIPRLFSDGRVIVSSFDPQSVVQKESYETPVLAPSSLAWRLYNAQGRALTGLEWAMRGSQNYPPNLKPVIFAPGAANPGFDCFYTQRRCIPNWVYWLAGGLTQPLPLASLPHGRYRLTVYAWDWAGNTSALDYSFKVPLASAAAAPFGPLAPRFDYP
jgi:hypothetical protein